MGMWKLGSWGNRLLAATAALGLAIMPAACGGGGGGGGFVPPPPGGFTATFTTNDGGAAPNLIRLIEKPGSAVGSQITLQVTIGGTTTSQDFYAFAFDILMADPTVVQFVAASAVEGPFLTGSLLTVLASQGGAANDRVIVGVSKQGAVPGNGTTNTEDVILELTFQVIAAGSSALTITGSTSPVIPLPGCAAMAPAAIDSQNPANCITSAVFGAGGTITGT
ncbi:MAG: hypothetical protein ACE5ID_01810 [Acidobacteriota bacterium]